MLVKAFRLGLRDVDKLSHRFDSVMSLAHLVLLLHTTSVGGGVTSDWGLVGRRSLLASGRGNMLLMPAPEQRKYSRGGGGCVGGKRFKIFSFSVMQSAFCLPSVKVITVPAACLVHNFRH